MKSIIMGLALSLFAATGYAQTWEEWIRPKQTQIKYLRQQIAKLQVYLGAVREGYAIVRQGLDVIGNIKEGEFDLHDLFFSNLKRVKEPIYQLSHVSECDALQRRIRSSAFALQQYVQQAPLLSDELRAFVTRQLEGILKGLQMDLQQLQVALSSGDIELSDRERIDQIQKIHNALFQKSEFITRFTAAVRLLCERRQKEFQETKLLDQRFNQKP